jgi:diguanylate cyclase (GGDEF)-like protein
VRQTLLQRTRGKVPIRVLLVSLVLVPWLALAFQTALRINEDREDLAITENLQRAATRVKLLADLERELHVEGGNAALMVAVRVSGIPVDLAEQLGGVPIRADLARSRKNVEKDVAALSPYLGIGLDDLKATRKRFDSPTMTDPYDPAYEELRARNRDALESSLQDLWVFAARLGSDQTLLANIRRLQLSIDAAKSSIEESNLLLNRSGGASFDRFGDNLIRESHIATLRYLRSLRDLAPSGVAKAADQILRSDDQAAIDFEATRLSSSITTASLESARKLYPILARRNLRLGKMADLAADEISSRSQQLVTAQRAKIYEKMIWLLTSLVGTLLIASLVARMISRPIRNLGQRALALNDGKDELLPLDLRGPRELSVSAQAFNDLASTLRAVQEQADALAAGRIETISPRSIPQNRLGSSVQLAVRRLSDSIQTNNQLRDDFAHAAAHDSLTGLPNRASIYQSLTKHLSAHAPVGLLFIDLDHFKKVNDLHGHHVGDEVLSTMANRFVACAAPNQTVGRLGGDEFIVVCTGNHCETAILELAERVIAAASQPIEIATTVLTLGASVGIAVSTQTDTASSLLRHADEALYRAKSDGRNRRAHAEARTLEV